MEGPPRTTLSGVFHRLRTGCPWRDRPGRYGPWQTVYERFVTLRASGRLGELLGEQHMAVLGPGRLEQLGGPVDGHRLRLEPLLTDWNCRVLTDR